MQAGRRTKHNDSNDCKNDNFLKISNFPPVRPDVTQGQEHGSRMPASAGGDGQGRCRGHIAGAKDKVSAAGTPQSNAAW
ncbi:unnamed protein product [Staurois parvus]|uniref:Uncharacterized protein n=1 Tax=Staurois parvus TaxID=386267 RepID=A0ABN9F9F4_9NEOB|nr:unnamed protein product [Staurois parvus]